MSGTESAVQDALRWLRFSNDDLRAALRMIKDDPPLPRHACWLCQQATEKSLKAALLLERISFPPTHDLDILRNLLPKNWVICDVDGDLSVLTEWAVDARYPGYWPEPSFDDAIEAESKARPICDLVSAEFKRRGIHL